MSNGYYPNGQVPNGYTPSQTVSVAAVPPPATRWDAATRAFTTTPTHPVDARMMFGLTVELGTIPGSPEIGVDRKKISATPLPRREAAIRDEIDRVTRAWVAAGDVAVRRVTVDLSVRGTASFVVEYENLRTRRVDVVRAKA